MYSVQRVLRTTSHIFRRTISTTQNSNMPIKVGDKLPSVELMESNPGNKVNIAELFQGKKGVIFAVVGAYTPTCDKTHLPGYVTDFDKLKAKGIDVIACVSVNDPFVMEAWGNSVGAGDKVRMLADIQAEFTKAIDMDFDASGLLGNVRSKRYSLLVEDGVVKSVNVEPDNVGATCSLSNEMLSQV